MTKTLALLTLVLPSFLVLLVVGAAGCEPTAVSNPTFDKDVKPILVAHCARCHGAGGSLQGDPAKYPLGTPPTGYNPKVPNTCFLDRYEDMGDCTAVDGGIPASCQHGAHSCATMQIGLFRGYVLMNMMPPPPAQLSDWEKDVIVQWLKNPVQ